MRRSEATPNAAFMRLPLPGRVGEGWRLSTNARLISPFEAVFFMRSFSAPLMIHHSTLYGRTKRVRWRTKGEKSPSAEEPVRGGEEKLVQPRYRAVPDL